MALILKIEIAFNLILSILFLVLHIGKRRIPVWYHALLYAGMGSITYCDVSYFSRNIYAGIVLPLILFILSDTNQHLLRKNYEEQMIEYQNKIIKNQVDEVQNVYLKMRGWRHDYHNHMQTLKAYLAMKNYSVMDKYLDELTESLDSIDFMIKSGNINLDAILNSKITMAKAKDINVNCKAKLPEKLTISDVDLCILIGNLLDNAIESCETMNEDSEKFIRIYIGIFKEQLYISVTNATKELVRKFDSQYITNKRGNHGHGLKRISDTVDKYGGYINRKNEPGVFVTEIMLPL